MKRLLFVALAALLLGLVPATATSPVPFGVGDACAQTGTCNWSPADICFVNGNPYLDREWIPAP